MEFSGKRVLVTGAGRGIGRCVALRLAGMGAEVFGVSRTQKELDSLKEEKPEIYIQSLDVGNWDATREAVQKMLPLDFVVNNAGVLLPKLLLDLTREEYETMLRVNIESPFNITQIVAKDLIAREKKGIIVNISSIGGERTVIGTHGYGSTKSALNMLTQGFACELGPYGIRVNSVNPGATQTDMLSSISKSLLESIVEKTPLKKVGLVDDVADAVVFLLSDKSSNITGAGLTVDGGYSKTRD